MAYYNSQYTGAEIDEALGKALTALQGDNLATVATTGSYSDLLNTPTLGTAAATDFTDYATAAQGALADTAVQPADLSTVATSGAYTDLTGLPTLGTAASTDSTAYATAAQGALADTAVQPADLTASISALVDSAPGTLDTLNELAAALGDDPNFASTITSSIGTKLNASAVSSFGLTLIDDADAATARGTLGLGTAATTESTAYATAAQGALADTAVQPAAIANFETTTELNSRDTANRARANHTGTQAASTITGLATVATSGSYNDLTDQPTFSSDLDGLTDVTITALTDEQILQYDAATSQWVNVDNAGGAGVPGGVDTQVQFNDGGVFAGDSDFTYNKTTNELSLAGDIKLDDGSTFETIVQAIPATANQVISFPDATGVVALTSDLTSKVSSDPTGVTGADAINNIISLTQAEYDAITPNASTFYVIVG